MVAHSNGNGDVLVDSGDWRVFTGNEMGCLLIWWMIHVYKSKGDGPGKLSLRQCHGWHVVLKHSVEACCVFLCTALSNWCIL